MSEKIILTGVKPTGTTHLGNLLGAIRPALELAAKPGHRSFLFIADYHGLTTIQKASELRNLTYEVAATWLALGLDPQKTTIYRQSDVPEIFELSWILSCCTSKGLMNRAHAYKARVDENVAAGKSDPDAAINMGLFSYPVLMASDILSFGAHFVPVGEDQVQHLEITRDIAQRFNHIFGETLVVPEVIIQKAVGTIPGIDGRKMSKSYDNVIPIFAESKKLRKTIMKIKTDSSEPSEPKDPNDSTIFDLYKLFATEAQIEELRGRYQSGIGWGDAKQALFEVIDAQLAEPREKYKALMADTSQLDATLADGAKKARAVAGDVMSSVRRAVGQSS